jgi:hypothetical protein
MSQLSAYLYFSFIMPGKTHHIDDDIALLIHEEGRESVEKIISLLDGYKPHMDIDPSHKKSLRQKLLSGKKSTQTFSVNIPWFSFVSSISIICTSFIAVFALYKIWLPYGDI